MPKEHFTVKLRNNVSCSRVGRRETPAGLPGQSAGECPLPGIDRGDDDKGYVW